MDAAKLPRSVAATRKSHSTSLGTSADASRQKIAQQKGPHQTQATKLYTDLRKNLVDTVYESWKETGFAWEQYNPETGKGQRTQHFTGWTSLVVKIMAMPDLGGERVRDEL
jgi:mannosyl-oligosaccharide glucosidase